MSRIYNHIIKLEQNNNVTIFYGRLYIRLYNINRVTKFNLLRE